MVQKKKIAVVVPSYNEHLLISQTLNGIPGFVDAIIVVNDASSDDTGKIIKKLAKKNKKIHLFSHKVNRGLGASLIHGYLEALKFNCDVIAVMAGDNQMDPKELMSVVSPIVKGQVDYVKGNRLLSGSVYRIMPKYRLVGNSIATFLTKFATGYWGVIDPQCGYTAISQRSLGQIGIKSLKKGYGYNADILTRLNILNYKIADIQVTPIYGKEKSGIKFFSYVVDVCYLLVKLFFRRMIRKYIVRDFHPLVFFYLMSIVSIVFLALPLGIRFLYLYFFIGETAHTTLIIFTFAFNMGLLSFFFATWMDMESNKDLFTRIR